MLISLGIVILWNIRRDAAHSVFICNSKKRKSYFELIDRWLDCLIEVCPTNIYREDLLRIVEPLPLIQADGSVKWL
jgi:hypothetical protein